MNCTILHCDRFLRKSPKNRGFLEKTDAENLQNFAETPLDFQFLPDNRGQDIYAYGDPYFRLDRIDRGAVEGLDPQILFDPLEEQFHLPATLVQLCDGQRRQSKVVCKEHESLVDIRGVIADATKLGWVKPRGFRPTQNDCLIASQSRGFVHGSIRPSRTLEVPLGSNDEEGQALGEGIQASKVRVAAVHHVERPGLDRQIVRGCNIRHATARDMHKTSDIAAQIDQRVQLHGTLVSTELCPRKQRKAQIDRGGIEGVGSLFQGQTKVVLEIQRPGLAYQHGCKVGIDSAVASFVGVRQGAARDLAANAHMIELGLHRTETGFDIAQALAIGQLHEGHAEKLVQTGEPPNSAVALISANTKVEFVPVQKIEHLSKNDSSGVHVAVLSVLNRRDHPLKPEQR